MLLFTAFVHTLLFTPQARGLHPLRQRAAERLGAAEIAPRLTLFHTGAEGRENVCVETVSFSPRVLGMNQTLQVRATLRNYGERGHDSLKVVCRVSLCVRPSSVVF